MSESGIRDFLISEPAEGDTRRQAVTRLYHADETEVVSELLAEVEMDAAVRERVSRRAQDLVRTVRDRKEERGLLDAFMQQYDLSSEEGVVLMCLAEALLRIPDDDTAEKLIADKLGEADWESHLGKSSSVLVNASTWGLMLTGKLVALSESAQTNLKSILKRLVNRSGEPMVRTAIRQAMKIMGHQYVMGRTIEEALDRSEEKRHRPYRHSFDMLGEAALTAEDTARFMEAYRNAIEAIGRRERTDSVFESPSISVKLSALHPRLEESQRDRVLAELTPRLLELAQLAKSNRMALTVDSEEANRLMLLLDVFEAVLLDPSLEGWNGLGMALQTYQTRAPAVIDFLADLSRRSGQRIPIRLVKGAYWDSEIKHAQVEGHEGYPVFTRKANTDVSYLACARKVLADRQAFYPQFATHNAHTIAAVTEMAGDRLDYEFQRLHGMGKDLYGVVMKQPGFRHACRVYAPVGRHEDLLPYLVRRLLENGSNTSFVNRISDESMPVESVAEDPLQKVAQTRPVPHPAIPLPRDLYGPDRLNSSGVNLDDPSEVNRLADRMQSFASSRWDVEPLLADALKPGVAPNHDDNVNPGNVSDVLGHIRATTTGEVEAAVAAAQHYQPEWDRLGGARRADLLERAADLVEARQPEFMVLLMREAGKTAHDAVSEIRETVDFLRYYALQARLHFDAPRRMPGPTGETNDLSLHGRGVFACISPWNFPLAIFTGQVSAALAAGNAVLAKPADQTPAIAALAVRVLHEAGVPRAALQFVPGRGSVVGAALTSDPRIAGVALTGSMATAHLINRALAARDAPLAAFIAETGGQNAMIVDSSALPQQVVQDVIRSAFHSAGQRCSALRVLYLQSDVADTILELLRGAMRELVVGDPRLLSTDIGPVIDERALKDLEAHASRMAQEHRLVARSPLPPGLDGHYMAPCAFEIESIAVLEEENFGPVLHVVRYRSRDLDRVIDEINATGFGLTVGVHSRIDHTQRYIAGRVRAGNCYINRNIIGAVVGVQPFGGENLSGTGPKAGGPHYMHRFSTERTLTVNTAAVGGNANLLDLND
ncbi:MAG: bifunctional proline dehydrogenase/L-glutamate gamma-semialdehyde dehydrogenase PutA [Gammaproteobacteria bacterium]|nr:bifunctional proline dehydrogenase/L-glutamate gamma-semialdehyde dehydrogenase PutA [Gammaproteobacteria bacterium]